MVTVARRPWLMVAALVLVLASGTVYAHRGATGIVKKRMDAITALGSAMKALTAMMRGKHAYNAERVKASAKTIAGHGGESLTSLFPEGSLKPPSRANPAIWADWDGFSALATQLAVYAGIGGVQPTAAGAGWYGGWWNGCRQDAAGPHAGTTGNHGAGSGLRTVETDLFRLPSDLSHEECVAGSAR